MTVNINSQFSFDNFLTGSCNQAAYALAVRAARGDVLEPVVIYGGAGKTHLLTAAEGFIRKARGARARLTTAESIRTDAMPASLAAVDVLLVDGLRDLGSLQMTLLDFVRQFPGLQLILACDQLGDIQSIDPRLRSRLRFDRLALLEELDTATKLVITRRLAEEAELELGQQAIELIASSTSDPREIMGIINQLSARVHLGHSQLTTRLVAEIAQELPGKSPAVTVRHVIQATAYVFGCTEADIRGGRRLDPELSRAGQIARYLARDLVVPRLSLDGLGEVFGDRGVGRARYSISRISDLLETDDALRHELRWVTSATRELAQSSAA